MKWLEIEHVTVYRGETEALVDVSFEIEAGVHTVLLGPNGAGKSTLLKLLSGELYPVPREGSRMRLFGQELWNVWEIRTQLGLVSHDLQAQYLGEAGGLAVVLSGFYASIGIYGHQRFTAEQTRRAEKIMAELGVEALRERPFAAMSAGEQRRCLLARALVHDPRMVVLDEPTSGLDIQATGRYLETVRGLMRRGKTVVLATHHLHEIPPEASRVVLMRRGRVVAEGPKDEMLTDRRLSSLFEIPLTVVQAHGWYQVVPGR